MSIFQRFGNKPSGASDVTVLMRFLTQGGAAVEVTKVERPDRPYQWRCLGCDREEDTSYSDTARSEANKHATSCRAMPKSARA
ncbi:hypothetical protein ACFU99_34955 [Streptomyces sp. NPDC057654]|uniref:hypothetical protein n=1 Tax=Streptomyces sp. NPDC057654 TaxID=3346196 RepID=UPI0036C25362